MSNEKGGLIKKKEADNHAAVNFRKEKRYGLWLYGATKAKKPVSAKPTAKPEVTKIAPPTPRKKLGVGKTNSTKSLKVPALIYSELNLLGSFMDEHKTYVILQNLIDSYVKNELIDRQKRQFDFMVEAFFEDK